MTSLGYVAFYDVLQDGKASLRWEHFLEKPVYNTKNKLDRKQLKWGFINTVVNKDYIFCMCSDKKTLLVFDYKGKLVKNYVLDRQVFGITISPDSKTVYASVNSPEAGIVRFFPDL